MDQKFFAGLEELFARLASFVLVIIGFMIFISARNVDFVLDWFGLIQVLGLFWFFYEILGLIFFQAFHFFAKQQIIPSKIESGHVQIQEQIQENSTPIPNPDNEKIDQKVEKTQIHEPIVEKVEKTETENL